MTKTKAKIPAELPHAQRELEFYRSEVEKVRSGIVVEVGVYVGRSLRFIAPTAKANENEVFAIDHWDWERMGVGEIGAGIKSQYPEPVDIQAIFIQHLMDDGLLGDINTIKMDSVEAAVLFLDRSVDLIFIDADHRYEHVLADIRAWLPKMRRGGVMLGHDYSPDYPGVMQAVDEVFGRPEQIEHTMWKVPT